MDTSKSSARASAAVAGEEKKGSLMAVGTGIRTFRHIGSYATRVIEQADRVYTVLTDVLTYNWIASLNPRVEDLRHLYQFLDPERPELGVARPRSETYIAWADVLVRDVRDGYKVAAVFYGHPGVFVTSTHLAIRRLREEGYVAEMLPAVSAEDCLFADLGVDPSRAGCAQYEASSFLHFKHHIDVSAGLILWQVGVVGDRGFQRLTPAEGALALLTEKLVRLYGPDHPVVIYEAANFPLAETRMEHIALRDLPDTPVSLISTLYLPPLHRVVPEVEFWERMGLSVPSSSPNKE